MPEVEVVAYDPAWPRCFEEAARVLRRAWGPTLIAIHHIGSTAIPGMPAKPVLDVLPVVRRLGDIADAIPHLERLGYEDRGAYGLPGRRYFVKAEGGKRTQHVHTYEDGDPAIRRHVAFRDYLITHPSEADRYAKLKVDLAARYRFERDRYQAGKAALIAVLETRALSWWDAEPDGGRRQAGAVRV